MSQNAQTKTAGAAGKTQRVVALAATAISKSNVDVLDKALHILRLGTRELEQFERWMNHFLSLAYSESASDQIFNIMLVRWKSDNPEESTCDTLGYILRNPLLSLPILEKVRDVFKLSFERCVFILAAFPIDGRFKRGLEVLDQLFPNPTPEVCRVLMAQLRGTRVSYTYGEGENEASFEAPSKGNGDMIEYIRRRYRKISNFAPIPSWIMDQEVELEAHRFEDDPSSEIQLFPTPDQAVNLLFENLNQHATIQVGNMYEVKDKVKEAYETSDDDLLYHLLLPIYTSHYLDQDDNVHLQRMFGPANIFISSFKDEARSSRMFTCTKFFDIDPLDDNALSKINLENPGPFDWFQGHCDWCQQRIEAYHHAVRMPMEGGGWYGSYCSWKCVKRDIVGKKTEIVDDHKIRMFLTKYFEKKIQSVKIYNRPSVDINDVVTRDQSIFERNAQRDAIPANVENKIRLETLREQITNPSAAASSSSTASRPAFVRRRLSYR